MGQKDMEPRVAEWRVRLAEINKELRSIQKIVEGAQRDPPPSNSKKRIAELRPDRSLIDPLRSLMAEKTAIQQRLDEARKRHQ
jgi:hypothetical protein